jgi:acetyltransferase-like isoleucine patch superfamily enzyme
MDIDSIYFKKVKARSFTRYYLGMLARCSNYLKNSYAVYIARKNGAIIGDSVSIPYSLAKVANSNLTIGNHCSIQTNKLDLRSPVNIGSYVIIGSDVNILTCSHNIDSPDWEQKNYGIVIEDYVWIASNVLVLPSCTLIGKGGVIAGGSVLSKKVEPMQVMSGNPAVFLRERKEIHYNLCVEELLGNDLKTYIAARKGNL